MGVPWFSMSKPRGFISLLLNILSYFKFMFTALLTHLTLLKPLEETLNSDEFQTPDYVLLTDRLCPSPIPVPVHVLMAMIKRKLPVMEYCSVVERCGPSEGEERRNVTCPVCLDWIEGRDEIRTLANCSHIFHRECVDRWVDEGQVTCPLCRSMLLPDNIGIGEIFHG